MRDVVRKDGKWHVTKETEQPFSVKKVRTKDFIVETPETEKLYCEKPRNTQDGDQVAHVTTNGFTRTYGVNTDWRTVTIYKFSE